jgi:hypothetical protein
MTPAPLPPILTRLVELCPSLKGRVSGMFQGCMRKGKATPAATAEWVLNTLRREAEERAAQGPARKPEYRSDRQYAREMRGYEAAGPRLDKEYLDALSTIGAVDRARLECGS